MKRIIQIACLLATSTAVYGQVLPVPVPTLLTGQNHKIFLGNGGAPDGGGLAPFMSQLLYTSVYSALQSSHMHTIVQDPSAADLDITVTERMTASVFNGDSIGTASLCLEIRDMKTHALLWVIAEPLQGAFREKTFEKNLATATTAVMSDLKSLAEGKFPTNAASAKYLPDATATPAAPQQPEAKKKRITDESK